VLARHVLGWDRTTLLVHLPDPPPAGFDSRFQPLVERRLRREPVAYITGRREFWGLAFTVTPDVLVPRPETEFVIEEALQLRADTSRSLRRIIDVGTGSGCLAVSLAVECREARVTATDTSRAALAVASQNAAAHGVADRIQFLEADLFGDAAAADLIVSNPPYVPEGDALPPEVARYEPKQALLAGADGMSVIRRLMDAAPRHLAPGGRLIVEFGCGQEALVRAAAAERGWDVSRIRADLQGIPRTVVLRR
jgi:release factor glutamine methyltransferase